MKNKIISGLLLVAMIASMFSFMGLGVSAKVSKYDDDVTFPVASITNITATADEYLNITPQAGAKLMYGLVGKDKSKAGSAKWYPLFGNKLDVSKYIPKTDAKETDIYVIAFTTVDTLANTAAKTAPAPCLFYTLQGRQDIKAATKPKTHTIWQAATGTDLAGIYVGLATDNTKISIKIGLGGWVDKTINGAKLESTDNWKTITGKRALVYECGVEAFPLGTTGVIRFPADDDNTFASAEVKFTIPKLPAAPKITKKADDPSYKKGTLNDKMEISVDGGKNWKDIPKPSADNKLKDAATVAEVLTAVGAATPTGTIYVRTKVAKIGALHSVNVELKD